MLTISDVSKRIELEFKSSKELNENVVNQIIIEKQIAENKKSSLLTEHCILLINGKGS